MKTAMGVNHQLKPILVPVQNRKKTNADIQFSDVKTLFPVIGPDFKFQDTTTVTGRITMMIERN